MIRPRNLTELYANDRQYYSSITVNRPRTIEVPGAWLYFPGLFAGQRILAEREGFTPLPMVLIHWALDRLPEFWYQQKIPTNRI